MMYTVAVPSEVVWLCQYAKYGIVFGYKIDLQFLLSHQMLQNMLK